MAWHEFARRRSAGGLVGWTLVLALASSIVSPLAGATPPVVPGQGCATALEQLDQVMSGSELPRKPAVLPDYAAEYPAVRNLARSPLKRGSLILDNNARIALTLEAENGALPAAGRTVLPKIRQNALDRIRRTPGADLRVPDQVVVETEHATERGVIQGGWKGTHVDANGLELTASRESAEYREIMAKLEQANVGSEKGGMDRQIVADALFAKCDPGVVPTLVTADQDLFNGLHRVMGQADLGASGALNDFVVTIKDSRGVERSLNVIPVPAR